MEQNIDRSHSGTETNDTDKKSAGDHALRILALNKDHSKEVARVEKFFDTYHQHYPLRAVAQERLLSSDFKSLLVNDDIVSALAFRGEKLVAYLAIRVHKQSSALELLHPVIHPEHTAELFGLMRAFSTFISDCAKKQKVSLIVQYCPQSLPLIQVLATKCFNTQPYAIVPYGVIDNNEQVYGEYGLVSVRVVQSDTAVVRSLYPPESHKKITATLYERLGIPFSIDQATNAPEDSSSDGLPVQLNHCNGMLAQRVSLEPALIKESTAVLSEVQSMATWHQDSPYEPHIQVCLNYPDCPKICRELEQIGYRFCGVLPLRSGRDYIVYSKIDHARLQKLTLYSKAARQLREYIVSQGLSEEAPGALSNESGAPGKQIGATRFSTFDGLSLNHDEKFDRKLEWIGKKFTLHSIDQAVNETDVSRFHETIAFYQEMQSKNGMKALFMQEQSCPQLHFHSSHRLSRGEIIEAFFDTPYVPHHPAFKAEFARQQRTDKTVRLRIWRHPPRERLGTVIAIHGWCLGDPRLNALTLVPGFFFKLGLDVVLYELPQHGSRKNTTVSRKDSIFPCSNLMYTNEAFGQIICELRAIREWVCRDEEHPVGTAGMSLGGYVAALWSSLDKLAFTIASVPLVSLPDLVQHLKVDIEKFELHRLSKFLESITVDDLKAGYAMHTPLNHSPLGATERRIIMAGRKDTIVPPEQTRELAAHWKECTAHWFEGDHFDQFRVANHSFDLLHNFLRSLDLAHKEPLQIDNQRSRKRA